MMDERKINEYLFDKECERATEICQEVLREQQYFNNIIAFAVPMTSYTMCTNEFGACMGMTIGLFTTAFSFIKGREDNDFLESTIDSAKNYARVMSH